MGLGNQSLASLSIASPADSLARCAPCTTGVGASTETRFVLLKRKSLLLAPSLDVQMEQCRGGTVPRITASGGGVAIRCLSPRPRLAGGRPGTKTVRAISGSTFLSTPTPGKTAT